MSAEDHDIKKEVNKYWLVFGALLVLTVLTVGANYLHVGIKLAIIVALAIATVKASLVACNFMHLSSEKKLIYLVLVMAAVFFAAMMVLIVSAYHSVPEGLHHVS